MGTKLCLKSICLTFFILMFAFVLTWSVCFADYLTCDPQSASAVTKYRIDLNGEILSVEVRSAGTDQVKIYYNIDHLSDGKYVVTAQAGNNDGEWSPSSNVFEFYRGVPTPQNINLFCGIEEDPTPVKISQQNWKVKYVSSECTKHERFGWMAIDGDLSTHWLADTNSIHPHELQIDLGRTYQISGFYHNTREEGTWSVSAIIKEYVFYVSPDGVTWAEVSAGELTEQVITFDLQAARYVRLVALSELKGTTRASVAELNIWGY